uniref:Uncharacterized protein n=1 Tax=Lactuca sativa TaxID=4236 RepID=A0A9R1X437_LACSA|nr:hypothetical protein LSAT_V11C700363240 [Lactuca sativa]
MYNEKKDTFEYINNTRVLVHGSMSTCILVLDHYEEWKVLMPTLNNIFKFPQEKGNFFCFGKLQVPHDFNMPFFKNLHYDVYHFALKEI